MIFRYGLLLAIVLGNIACVSSLNSKQGGFSFSQRENLEEKWLLKDLPLMTKKMISSLKNLNLPEGTVSNICLPPIINQTSYTINTDFLQEKLLENLKLNPDLSKTMTFFSDSPSCQYVLEWMLTSLAKGSLNKSDTYILQNFALTDQNNGNTVWIWAHETKL